MATGRKKHPHPPLCPPRTVHKITWTYGMRTKEVTGTIKGDHGKVIDGVAYFFHYTKGWRRQRVYHE